MATVLPTLQQLRCINFGDCLVRPDGARALASAIQDGHKLLEVGVWGGYYTGSVYWLNDKDLAVNTTSFPPFFILLSPHPSLPTLLSPHRK